MIKIAKIQFNPFGENTYVLSSTNGECIIVDAGMYSDDEKQTLVSYIEKNNLKPIMAISTHGHVDHICGAQFVVKQWDIPFAIHSADKFLLDGASEYGASMGFDMEQVPQINIDLAVNTKIVVGEDTIDVVATPGHSPGGVCFYIPSQKVLITGDTIFNGSIGRTDLPQGDYNMLMNSIIKNLLPLGGDVQFFPGHGSDSTLAYEAQHNPFITEIMNGEVRY